MQARLRSGDKGYGCRDGAIASWSAVAAVGVPLEPKHHYEASHARSRAHGPAHDCGEHGGRHGAQRRGRCGRVGVHARRDRTVASIVDKWHSG